MKSNPESQEISFTGRVLIIGLILLPSLLGVLSSKVFESGLLLPPNRYGNVYNMAQFKADARTFAAAVTYLLEPEPEPVVIASIARVHPSSTPLPSSLTSTNPPLPI
jgi:hypothetical protein